MKTVSLIALAMLATVSVLSSCGRKNERVPDSVTTGMEGGTAPSGAQTFGQSSGQGTVQPQNIGGPADTPISPPPSAGGNGAGGGSPGGNK